MKDLLLRRYPIIAFGAGKCGKLPYMALDKISFNLGKPSLLRGPLSLLSRIAFRQRCGLLLRHELRFNWQPTVQIISYANHRNQKQARIFKSSDKTRAVIGNITWPDFPQNAILTRPTRYFSPRSSFNSRLVLIDLATTQSMSAHSTSSAFSPFSPFVSGFWWLGG